MTNLEEVINKAVEKSVKEAILAAHPVGSFYFSDNDANPAEVFGGGGMATNRRGVSLR